MDRVIVTVERREWGDECDLELPADVRVGDLARELALAWGGREDWAIYAYPANRTLAIHETLAQAGVRDGARLVLLPAHVGVPNQSPAAVLTQQPAATPTQQPSPSNGAPIRGWRPLGVTQQPTTQSSDPLPPPSKGGFIWRRVDHEGEGG